MAQVREHFENIADAESRFASGERVPFLAIDQFEGASVVWTSVADGRRKGVIIQRNAGAVEYTLLDSEALEVPTASTGGSSSSVLLPGGAKAPAGSRAGLSIVDGASSFSFFDAPGSPDTVADELKKSLAGAGYEVDAKHEEAIEETTRLRGSSSRVVVPFKGKENKGFLIVAPQGAGSSRATVVVR